MFTRKTAVLLAGIDTGLFKFIAKSGLLPFDRPDLDGDEGRKWARYSLGEVIRIAVMHEFMRVYDGVKALRACTIAHNLFSNQAHKLGIDLIGHIAGTEHHVWGGAIRFDAGDGMMGGEWFIGPIDEVPGRTSKMDKPLSSETPCGLEIVNLTHVFNEVLRRAKENGIEIGVAE